MHSFHACICYTGWWSLPLILYPSEWKACSALRDSPISWNSIWSSFSKICTFKLHFKGNVPSSRNIFFSELDFYNCRYIRNTVFHIVSFMVIWTWRGSARNITSRTTHGNIGRENSGSRTAKPIKSSTYITSLFLWILFYLNKKRLYLKLFFNRLKKIDSVRSWVLRGSHDIWCIHITNQYFSC